MVIHPWCGEKVVVLFSGGVDSTVIYWWAMNQGASPVALSIDYRGRPRAEKYAAKSILSRAGFPLPLEISLSFYTDEEHWPNENGVKEIRPKPPAVYLPSKNLIFYGIATYYAERLGAVAILGGHYRKDQTLFPDANRDFFQKLSELIRMSTWTPRSVELVLPFLEWDKSDIIRLGYRLGVPLEDTWSCYGDGDTPCGVCEGCREVKSAIELGKRG